MPSMLTTVDNPYDPFTHYDEWWAWDFNHGYHTPGLLARVATVTEDLPLPVLERAIEFAIDEIVLINASGVHRKVTRD